MGAHAVIGDFGVAVAVGTAGGDRLTHNGVWVGTPGYKSLEQAVGEVARVRPECITSAEPIDSARAVARFGAEGRRGAVLVRTVPTGSKPGC